MQSRRKVRIGWGVALTVLTASVGLTARGQDQPSTKPNTTPTRTAPGYTVRPPTPPAYKNATGGSPEAPKSPSAYPTRPRLTQPVIAGPDGVRPAATRPSVLPDSESKPAMLPPSVNVEPQPPAIPKLPDPKPLDPNESKGSDPVQPGPSPAPLPAIPGGNQPLPAMPAVPGDQPPPTPATAPAPTAPAPTADLPAFQEQSKEAMPQGQTPLASRAAPSLTVDAVAPESVGVGQPLTYELVIRNVGTSQAMNVRVEDVLPAGAALVGSEPSAETSGDRMVWSLGTLDAGVEKRIKVTVKPADEGELQTVAMVTFATAVEARVKVTRPKLAVAVSVPESNRVGEKIPFTIKLSNTGTGTASRVTLRAQFSEGLAHPQGQVIEAELAALKAGETRTLNLEAIGQKSGTHSCTLTAAANGQPAEAAKASLILVEPKLVAKQTGPEKCLVRSEPVYQIELSNPGTATTDPVQVWTNLPNGFEFVSASEGGAFAESNHSVGWRLQGLPAGSTKMLSLKIRATAPSEGVIRTVATASATAETVTPAGGVPEKTKPSKGLESRIETPIKSEGVPALRFEVVDLSDPIIVGQEAIYEIRVVNQGTGPCTNVQLIAEMSEGMSATAAAGPTNGKVTGQRITFEPIPNLAVKGEVVYKVRVKGSVAGDQRFRGQLVCDQIKTPVVKEESTRFYSQ